VNDCANLELDLRTTHFDEASAAVWRRQARPIRERRGVSLHLQNAGDCDLDLEEIYKAHKQRTVAQHRRTSKSRDRDWDGEVACASCEIS
jgi:hypothetical protein